jgi:hypothetical protein
MRSRSIPFVLCARSFLSLLFETLISPTRSSEPRRAWFFNLAEGARSAKGNRQKHYSLAHGSANEVRAALETAEAWGWLESASAVLPVLDRLLGLLWGLTHPK